ncbi:spermidine synthase [Hoyosella subflava]|nr:fused MFS/spermidine synthase [Hoyosella subflava]
MTRRDGLRPTPGIHPIDTGTCELVKNPDRADSWMLLINGVPSSSIDVHDAARLDFGYMQWIATLAEARWESSEPLKMLHLGAGACSLPRYLATRFTNARQVAVDIDATLAKLVREWFDLPKAPLLKIRTGDARAVVESLHPSSRDFIVRDVFAGDTTPYPLTTVEFAEHVRRVLRPGGVYAVNSGSIGDAAAWRHEAATLSGCFRHVMLTGEAAALRGRRHGNVVIAASDSPLPHDEFTRRIRRNPVPMVVYAGPEVKALGARPRRDG